MQNGLAHVGSVECDTSANLCEKAKVTEKLGVYYFPPGTFPKGGEGMHHFTSLDAREIHSEFMEKLVPGLNVISKEKLQVSFNLGSCGMFDKFGELSNIWGVVKFF